MLNDATCFCLNHVNVTFQWAIMIRVAFLLVVVTIQSYLLVGAMPTTTHTM